MDPLSPEPVKIMSVAVVEQVETPNDLRRKLDRERGRRVVLEEQIRQLENQLYQHQIYHLSSTEENEEIATLQVGWVKRREKTERFKTFVFQVVAAESLPPVGHTQTVVCSPPPSRSPSPEPSVEQRLPSVLEAAIKAEPKVEVERLPSPTAAHEETTPSRMYPPPNTTSRQNLETIVEAIRHLEGDHMFAEEPQQTQDVPLALTTRTPERVLKVEMNQFLEFHTTPSIQLQQQSRPGVIVVKSAS